VTFNTTGFDALNQTIRYESDGDIYFNFTVAPEPGLILALPAGAMLVAGVWRRLRKPFAQASV
jgi:hypothetical protein